MTTSALCIFGMHRSGTSAMAGSLRLLGVELGNRLAPGHNNVNALGYFEHIDILKHHDALLSELGSHWDDILPLPDDWWKTNTAQRHTASILATLKRDFGSSPFWGVKDPRLCRLIPLWFPPFASLDTQPYLVIVLRRPDEVAASLSRRDGMAAEKAYQLWLENTMAAERWGRGHPRAFITYDALLEDPIAVTEELGAVLGLSWPVAPAAVCEGLKAFMNEELHHERGGIVPADPRGPATILAFEVWSALSTGGLIGPNLSTLDALQECHYSRIASLDSALVAHLRAETARRIDYQRRLATIHGSLSWKLSKPLRIFHQLKLF